MRPESSAESLPLSDHLRLAVGERSILCSRPGLGLFAEAAQRVRTSRLREFDALLELCESLPAEERRAALSRAIEEQQAIVTDQETLDWLQSPAGEAFLFWCSVRAHQPETGESDAADLFATLGREQIDELAAFFAAGLPAAEESPSHDERSQREVMR